LGVVLGLSPPLLAVGVEVLAEIEPVVELLEDPQPAANASVAQARSIEAPVFIGVSTLA
jgi:hypothetical protein